VYMYYKELLHIHVWKELNKQSCSVCLVKFCIIVSYVIFPQQYGTEALWPCSLCTTTASGLVVQSSHVKVEQKPAQDSSWRVVTGPIVLEKYSGSIVQVDWGQSEWGMWLESTTHVNQESGWVVQV